MVTDRRVSAGGDLVAAVTAALDAGLPAVQLREKDLPGAPLLVLAEALRLATARTGALLFVNDRIDVALAVGADGVHLGAGAVSVAVARRLLPVGALIGVSTHAPGEASAEGADFIFFGPMYPTPSKAGPPAGESGLRAAVAAARTPVLAIGGIDVERIGAVTAAGAAGVAVIRAILAAPDPAAATRTLLTTLGRHDPLCGRNQR